MTQPKQISQVLSTLLINPIVLDVLDRSKDCENVANIAKGWWDYDLFGRKPSPAYDDYGVFKGTDLDLACFMYALSGRGAVINIPRYKAATKATIREDQKLASTANRNGEIVGVIGNQSFFKFSVKIIDQNVIGEDKVGDYRSFSMTDYNGSWYPGWDTIQFVPTIKENRFITENELWSGNRIVFKNFVHPNRWTSFFGYHYVVSKLVIDRLAEEVTYLNAQVKKMLVNGLRFPESEGPQAGGSRTYGKTKSMRFDAFESKIFIPEMDLKGEFLKIKSSVQNMIDTYDKSKRLRRIKEALTFMTRATEYAHYINPDRMPAWIKNTQWEGDFVIPGGRTKWDRLKLFQPEVGKHAVSILRRSYQKAAQVAEDY